MFDFDEHLELPEPHDSQLYVALPIELDPEYIAAKERFRKLREAYLMVAYHNYKTLSDDSFGMGD